MPVAITGLSIGMVERMGFNGTIKLALEFTQFVNIKVNDLRSLAFVNPLCHIILQLSIKPSQLLRRCKN
jgi:hypothetical protein